MQFYIVDGELVSGGEVVSANAGEDRVPLAVSPTRRPITTTWEFRGGELVWANGNFTGGRAGFCRDVDGEVYATFEGGEADWRAGCEDVRLLAVIGRYLPSSDLHWGSCCFFPLIVTDCADDGLQLLPALVWFLARTMGCCSLQMLH